MLWKVDREVRKCIILNLCCGISLKDNARSPTHSIPLSPCNKQRNPLIPEVLPSARGLRLASPLIPVVQAKR